MAQSDTAGGNFHRIYYLFYRLVGKLCVWNLSAKWRVDTTLTMLYELAHLIKDRCSFVWNFMEWGNSVAFSFRYRKGLKCLNEVVNVGVPEQYTIREAGREDVRGLFAFFSKQPKESFRFFKPHGFDESSIRTILDRVSFLTFVLLEKHDAGDEIVGYAFLRCFVNGSSYRGYMVDAAHRGRGLAKIIGCGLNRVGDALHLDMYKSISPQNPASMKVTQAVCNIEMLKILENGDYLIKCSSKTDMKKDRNLIGGGNFEFPSNEQAFMPQNRLRYAA